MKRFIMIFLAVLVCMALVACDGGGQDVCGSDTTTSEIDSDTTVSDTEETVETTKVSRETTAEAEEALSLEELMKKYPPISEEEYNKFMTEMIENDPGFADGVSRIGVFIEHFATEEARVEIGYTSVISNRVSYSYYTTTDYFNKLDELLGNDLKSVPINVEHTKAYTVDLSNNNLNEDKLNSLWKVLYDAKSN